MRYGLLRTSGQHAASLSASLMDQARSATLWRRIPPSVWVVTAAVIIGGYLRLDQITSQVLIDDEWHIVHTVISATPSQMFFDFGLADYSLPLGILAWYETQWWFLSETVLRLPMLLCG